MATEVIPGDPFVHLDPRFAECVVGSVHVERIATGCRWVEGPAWFPAGRYLLWSDIPNDRIMKWDETTDAVSVFRHPAGFSNGNTVDRQGRLVTAHHGLRAVTRTEVDGSVTVLADHWDGRRFNSPNDVVVSSDGAVWFTDPPYGIDSDYEGHKADPEQAGNHVYRIDPGDRSVTRVADDFDRPNGLAFTPDESRLLVTDTGAPPRVCRVFDVDLPAGTLSGGEVWATETLGGFDGFRLDVLGRCWMSAADGVHCLSPDGELLGKVLVPEPVANVVFGGPKRNRLFICATTSIYSVFLATNGAPTF